MVELCLPLMDLWNIQVTKSVLMSSVRRSPRASHRSSKSLCSLNSSCISSTIAGGASPSVDGPVERFGCKKARILFLKVEAANTNYNCYFPTVKRIRRNLTVKRI